MQGSDIRVSLHGDSSGLRRAIDYTDASISQQLPICSQKSAVLTMVAFDEATSTSSAWRRSGLAPLSSAKILQVKAGLGRRGAVPGSKLQMRPEFSEFPPMFGTADAEAGLLHAILEGCRGLDHTEEGV